MQKDLIGFWGYIPKDIVKNNIEKYKNVEFIDLDVGFNAPLSNILPDAYCKILKNIVDNAIFLKERLIKILAPVGKDKCDGGFFVAHILEDMGFLVEKFTFEENVPKNSKINVPISKSNIPLKEKVELITSNIIKPVERQIFECEPKFGFWGVPPHDLSILEMFPPETHIYGWLRCVEAGYPSDIELEKFVDSGVPTVFYCQTFCAKNSLARYLADKYNGLYIDIDGISTNSAKAKIEAFLRLR